MRRYLLNLPTLLWMLSAGCYSYVPVSVRVIDAETHAPVAGAKVQSLVVLPGMMPVSPKSSADVADRRGRALVRISNTGANLRGARVTAVGYLESRTPIPPERFRRLSRDRRNARAVAADASPHLTVELYRLPHPYFVLVLPNGYRGLLRLDRSSPAPERALGVAERAVEVVVEPPAPHKLPSCRLGAQYVIDWRHYTARYEDGTPIPSFNDRALKGDEVALRQVRGHNMRDVFIIGTESDERAFRPMAFDELWEAATGPHERAGKDQG